MIRFDRSKDNFDRPLSNYEEDIEMAFRFRKNLSSFLLFR